MKTSKVMIVLMAVLLIVTALSFLAFPGFGVLMTLTLMTVSMAFFVVPIVGLLKRNRTRISEGTDGEMNVQSSSNGKTRVFLLLMGFALSVLTIGALFRLMHWPGGSLQSSVGMYTALPMALLTYIVSRNDKVDTLAKWAALMAVVCAILFGTNYLYQTRDLFLFRDFPQCQEAIALSYQDSSRENVLLQAAEREKVFVCKKDPELYREMTALETKAKEMAAADEHGKVLFVAFDENRFNCRVYGAYKNEVGMDETSLSLHQYVSQEVTEGDVLYVVSVTDGVKEKLVELGVEEGNIVVVGQ